MARDAQASLQPDQTLAEVNDLVIPHRLRPSNFLFSFVIQPGFRSCRKRGGILEQRRRPTVKFQSHFALSHVVAMRLDIPRCTADRCLLRGRNPSTSLRKGCASRFLSIATAESGFNARSREAVPSRDCDLLVYRVQNGISE